MLGDKIFIEEFRVNEWKRGGYGNDQDEVDGVWHWKLIGVWEKLGGVRVSNASQNSQYDL